MLFVVCWFFFSKSAFLKNSFRKTISVKQLGSRSGPTFYKPWSGTKLFANVVSRLHFPFCPAWSRSKLFANVISREHFVGPDLYLNCLQTWSAEDSLLGLNWIQIVCKCNQQTTFCRAWTGSKLFANVISRRHFVGPEVDPYCLQM